MIKDLDFELLPRSPHKAVHVKLLTRQLVSSRQHAQLCPLEGELHFEWRAAARCSGAIYRANVAHAEEPKSRVCSHLHRERRVESVDEPRRAWAGKHLQLVERRPSTRPEMTEARSQGTGKSLRGSSRPHERYLLAEPCTPLRPEIGKLTRGLSHQSCT
eukprot:scaffold86007_cov118-Phaeocystis_antarctica.AAC.1